MTTPLEPWICVTEFYLVMLRRTTWFWALIIHSAAQCFGSTTSRQTPLLLLRSLSDIKDFPQSIFLSRPTRSLGTTPAKRLQHQTLRHLFTVNDSESIPVSQSGTQKQRSGWSLGLRLLDELWNLRPGSLSLGLQGYHFGVFLVDERTTLTLGPQEVLVTRGSESCKMYPKISRTSTAENFSDSNPWVILLFFRERRKRTSPWYYFISVDRALRWSTLFVLYGPRNLSTEVWWLKECHKDQIVQQIRTLIF